MSWILPVLLRNSASGLEIGLPGRISAGLLPGKHRDRPRGLANVGSFWGPFALVFGLKRGQHGLKTGSTSRAQCRVYPLVRDIPVRPPPSCVQDPESVRAIAFGDIHGPKPYEFIGFGDSHGP